MWVRCEMMKTEHLVTSGRIYGNTDGGRQREMILHSLLLWGEKLSTYEQIQMRGVEHSNRQSLSARHVMIMMKNSPNVSRDTLGRHIQCYMTILQRTVLTVWKLYKECPSQPPPKLPSPSTSSWSLSISTSLSPLISSHSILKYKTNKNKTTVTFLYFIAVRN